MRMTERPYPQAELPSTGELIRASMKLFTDDFPQSRPPYGLLDEQGQAVEAIESYEALAEYSAFSLIYALGETADNATSGKARLSTDQAAVLESRLLRVAEPPVNGMFTIVRLFEAIPEVLRIKYPGQQYTAKELTAIANNSTDIPLQLAGNSSYRSRLLYAGLALSPHFFYSKDGALIQKDKLDPHKLALEGEGEQRKLVVAQPDMWEAQAQALHDRLTDLTGGDLPDFNTSGRCPAYSGISALQSRIAHIAGATLFQAEAQKSIPQLPGKAYFDEGPAIVRAAVAGALGHYVGKDY